MKTREELNAIREEYDNLNRKLRELTEEELEQVTGGLIPIPVIYSLLAQTNDGIPKKEEII